MKDEIRQVAEWIADAKRVVVFVGAGMSTESGIPDFRSPGGLWEKYNPQDFYFDRFLASEVSRQKYWEMATETYNIMKDAQWFLGRKPYRALQPEDGKSCVLTCQNGH